ncbi:hypothetical protein Kkor_0723 [Kangiella koreensis DSM 16069]|uniref:Uncharacterized protein n=1 Tax=Kangiella koreensis (strain DSM 16069 / JCM 12317 / KCTC 12182 / SW-125) TaxID=523791 RepID=C7RA24_KANKD|nr:hypothetical protein Kkor_0723 [Kangiella koreensis DSM 16069]
MGAPLSIYRVVGVSPLGDLLFLIRVRKRRQKEARPEIEVSLRSTTFVSAKPLNAP